LEDLVDDLTQDLAEVEERLPLRARGHGPAGARRLE
jgi:hypothetical protein